MSRWLPGLAASLVLVAVVVLAGCSHETLFVREAPDAPTGFVGPGAGEIFPTRLGGRGAGS